MLRIISTALHAPTRERCIRSVQMQVTNYEWRHIYIEAGEQDPRKCALENFTETARECDPGDILVSLDGDDWLPDGNGCPLNTGVLETIGKLYDDPNLWITWGSFVFADGREGFAAPYIPAEWANLRKAEWKATHMKAYRAALFHHLGDAELKRPGPDGEFVFRDLCWDLCTMTPMLEMAGPEHSRFVPDILYCYNYATSTEMNASPEERRRETAMGLEIRALPPLARLASL
jgi:hypothetical protein